MQQGIFSPKINDVRNKTKSSNKVFSFSLWVLQNEPKKPENSIFNHSTAFANDDSVESFVEKFK